MSLPAARLAQRAQWKMPAMTGKVKVISFDFVDETMEFVKKGVISATIGQGPIHGRDDTFLTTPSSRLQSRTR